MRRLVLRRKRKIILAALFLLFAVALLIFVLWSEFRSKEIRQTEKISDKLPIVVSPKIQNEEAVINASGRRIYRNENWGFEFKYSGDWIFDESYINGDLRKYRLVAAPSEKARLIYKSLAPFSLSIVTPERADRLVEVTYDQGNPTSEVKVGNVSGIKYEYKFNYLPSTAIILPFHQYKLIFESNKEYEDLFKQVISTWQIFDAGSFSGVDPNSSLKTYRNTEYGFEFNYPANYPLYENTFTNGGTKFSLITSSPKEDGYPNSIIPPLALTVVTKDFANNVVLNVNSLKPTISDVLLGGIKAKKYSYTANIKETAIIVPFEENFIILSSRGGYDSVFNEVVSSFQFVD